MGSFIEINDTLRITAEQGFPVDVLDVEKHFKNPYTLKDVEGKVFTFQAKPKIRIYKIPPVRNMLVQEIDGKWLYWGLCLIDSLHHDNIKQETSGTFHIIKINSPEEMKQAYDIVDTRPGLNYFS